MTMVAVVSIIISIRIVIFKMKIGTKSCRKFATKCIYSISLLTCFLSIINIINKDLKYSFSEFIYLKSCKSLFEFFYMSQDYLMKLQSIKLLIDSDSIKLFENCQSIYYYYQIKRRSLFTRFPIFSIISLQESIFAIVHSTVSTISFVVFSVYFHFHSFKYNEIYTFIIVNLF